MKKIFKVLIFLLLIGMSIALLFIGNGYNMYKEAIENMPLEEKVEEIKRKENYAEFSELPQMYVNAVISVEDKRFYKHNGIDINTIREFLGHVKIDTTEIYTHLHDKDVLNAIEQVLASQAEQK